MLRKTNNVLLCFMTSTCAADKHSPQCKFLSSSTTDQSGASTMSSRPATQGRKQLLLWLTALNDAPYKHTRHWYESPKQRNEEISLNYPLCNTPGIYIHAFPHWITCSESNGMYRTTNGNYMIYKREVSWDNCLLWHQHIWEDFNKETCEHL